jgi:hypothetical protein
MLLNLVLNHARRIVSTQMTLFWSGAYGSSLCRCTNVQKEEKYLRNISALQAFDFENDWAWFTGGKITNIYPDTGVYMIFNIKMIFSVEVLSDFDVLYHGMSPAGVLPILWERRCTLTDRQYV